MTLYAGSDRFTATRRPFAGPLASAPIIIALWLALFPAPARAQLVQGDTVTTLSTQLIKIAAGTGVRTLLHDFSNPSLGPPVYSIYSIAIESPESVLALALNNVLGIVAIRVRVNGEHAIIAEFSNPTQGETINTPERLVMGPPGIAYVLDEGIVYRMNLANGERRRLSNIRDESQGELANGVSDIAVAPGGEIVLLTSLSGSQRLYRVNASTGQRTLLSDVARQFQTSGTVPSSMLLAQIDVEPSGNVLVVDFLGRLVGAPAFPGGLIWRVNGVTGAGTVLSNPQNTNEGISGFLATSCRIGVDGSGGILMYGPVLTTGKGYLVRIDSTTGRRTVVSDFNEPGQGPLLGNLADIDVFRGQAAAPPSTMLLLQTGGAASISTPGRSTVVRTGYATVSNTGPAPYGAAVFSFAANGVVTSEVGVAASPPAQSANIFVDYQTGVNAGAGTINIYTGLAIAHRGDTAASITYTLRDRSGQTLAIGHGTLAVGAHFGKFIQELREVAPDFNLPSDFPVARLYGSLEIASTQPVSLVALRMTVNQRGETLLTTTPVAYPSASTTTPLYFPHLADGGGYTTTLVLLNTSAAAGTGTLQVFDSAGAPLSLRTTDQISASSFNYSIPPGGTYILRTDGSAAAARVGWVKLNVATGTTPVGAGVFSYSPAGVLVTEAGISSTALTTRARIYVDKSGGHDTGLAIVNPAGTTSRVVLQAFQMDGITPAGSGPGEFALPPNGHAARFVSEAISGLNPGFTGVLEISAVDPFAALTLRSLINVRGDFLLTTLPIADANQPAPAPIVFPHIADGGGYYTQFIFVSAAGPASIMVSFLDEAGLPMDLLNAGP